MDPRALLAGEEVAQLLARIAKLEAELERTRKEASELRKVNDDLTDFVEKGRIGLHWLGPDGVVLWANEAELEMLGYSYEEYVGRKISDFHADPQAMEDILRRLASGEVIDAYEARLRCKDGSLRDVLITSNVRWQDGAFVHTRCFTRDVSDRKRTEGRLAVQYAVSRILTEHIRLETAAPEILHEVAERLGFSVGIFWMPEPNHQRLQFAASWSADPHAFAEFVETSRARVFASGEGLPGRVISSESAEWIETLTKDPNFPRAPIAAAAGLKTGLAFPIEDGGGVLGVMEFFSLEVRKLDAEMLEALAALGRQIGLFLRRDTAERDVQSRLSQIQILYRMAERVNRASKPAEIYLEALDTLELLMRPDAAAILLLSSEGTMRFETWRGISDAYRAATESYAPWEKNRPTFEPVIIPDVFCSERMRNYRAVIEQEGIRALAFVPLVAQRRLLGSFALYYGTPHTFADHDIALARLVANHIAAAAERRRQEAELQESETRLRIALAAARIGVWEWDIRKQHIMWSDRVYEIHGVSPGSLSGRPEEVAALFHPDDRGLLTQAVATALEEKGSYQLEFRILRPDGEVRWISTSGRVICDEAGNPIRMLGTTRDITERKRGEESLRESAETVRALFESASHAILTSDRAGRIINANAMAEKLFGYTRDELEGQSIELLVPDRAREIHAAHRAAFHEAPKTRPMGAGLSLTARCKDGAEVPVEISLSHILSRHGLLAVTFIHDVTERLRAERDLRDSEARYRSLFEQSNDALAVSVNGKYTQVNAAFARMFGYSHPEEFHGMSIYDTVPPDCRPAIQERRERRAGQQLRPVIYESRGLRRDGSQFVSEVRATDYWMEGRLHTLVILRDITAEREAEEALTRQAEALARSNADLQQFAYVTSHDLQEPLRSIASYAQLLERRYSGKLDEDADQFIGFLTAGVKRMQALIHDLLAFSRVANSDTVGFGTVDLRDALRWAEMNLQSSIQESGANVVCAALPAVRGDHIQLVQLLQNLLGNAIKYRSSAPPQIEIRAESRGEEWLFSVSDNGIGIPPEYHEHVFGLFRRLHTRDVPGTGIGLAICKRIVEKHGGRIWVESDGSSGSTFFFTLPAAAHRLP